MLLYICGKYRNNTIKISKKGGKNLRYFANLSIQVTFKEKQFSFPEHSKSTKMLSETFTVRNGVYNSNWKIGTTLDYKPHGYY